MSEYGKKYPWLRVNSLYDSEDGSDYDAMDDIPAGWRIAFGDLLCEELDAAIKKAGIEDEFSILDIKEKYGHLVVYVSPGNIPEINAILDKYMILSKNICMTCGKPDTHALKFGSQVYPTCEGCFYKHFSYMGIYDDLTYAGDGKMRNSITVIRNENGYEEYKIYIKDTADKIRARWAEREIGRS